MSRVILFSLTAAVNPTLVAATTVLLLLPSPKKLMLGYLAGAYMTSITIGCVIVLTLGQSGAVTTTQKGVNPTVDIVVGALLTLPGASYLAALDSIHKLNYGKAEEVLLVVLVNVIMLALIELPLLSFAVAPKWTPAAIERTKAWFGRHGHTAAFTAVTTIGTLLVVQGVVTLIAS
jgi:hypothetical protein